MNEVVYQVLEHPHLDVTLMAVTTCLSFLTVICLVVAVRGPVLRNRQSRHERAEAVCVQHGHGQLQRGGHHAQQFMGRRGQVEANVICIFNVIFVSLYNKEIERHVTSAFDPSPK